jgi:hypothetical protein
MSSPSHRRAAVLGTIALVILALSIGLSPGMEAFRGWKQRLNERRVTEEFAPYQRYYDLTGEVRRAARSADTRAVLRAEPKARELLRLSGSHSLPLDFWNHDNAVHYGHLLLGRVALLQGNVSDACCRLLCAADIAGSPQLSDYGPDMTLADELLAKGQVGPVLEYFSRCQRFWSNARRNRLLEWYLAVLDGATPDFGSHSRLRAQPESAWARPRAGA